MPDPFAGIRSPPPDLDDALIASWSSPGGGASRRTIEPADAVRDELLEPARIERLGPEKILDRSRSLRDGR